MEALLATLIEVRRLTLRSDGAAAPQFTELTESLPHFVWMVDGTGLKTYCSRSYLQYTGLDRPEQLTAAWVSLLHPEDRERVTAAWNRSVISGAPYHAEYRLCRRDGVYRHIRASARCIRDGEGRISAWLGISQDIEDEVSATQARSTVERLHAVRRMAASIAHEINNPLEAVTNSIYLALRDEALGQSTRAYLELADEQLARVAQVVRQGLRFDPHRVGPEPCRVSELAHEVLTAQSERAVMLGVEVRFEPRVPGEVLCDRDELRVLVSALVCNAMDAMPDGGTLRVRVSGGQDGSGSVRLTVADTGEGIPKELRKQVFHPFFSTRGDHRAGLALWSSEQMAKKHGGRITFRSRAQEPWQGSVFCLTLPAAGKSFDEGAGWQRTPKQPVAP